MINVKQVNDEIQAKIKKAKQKKDVTAIEIFSICNIPIELLMIEEERIVYRVLSSLLKSNGYITETSIHDFFAPNDFYFKNKGYLILL